MWLLSRYVSMELGTPVACLLAAKRALVQVLAPITDALEAQEDWSALSKGAGLVAEHVLKPLFALLRDSAARSHHGQVVGQQPPEQCPEGSRAEA